MARLKKAIQNTFLDIYRPQLNSNQKTKRLNGLLTDVNIKNHTGYALCSTIYHMLIFTPDNGAAILRSAVGG